MRRNKVGRSLEQIALMVAVVAASGACKRPKNTDVTAPAAARAAAPAAVEVDTPPAPTYRLVAAPGTKLNGAPPKLTIVSPEPNAVVGDDVMLHVKLHGWPRPEAPGGHIHVVIDDLPFLVIDDVTKPVALTPMLEKLNVQLRPGRHFLRVFPAHASHESVKEGSPFAYQVFHYEKRVNDKGVHKHMPLLTYIQPHGCYRTNTPIPLDFYLANTEIGRYGHRVQLAIDGTRPKAITKWEPYHIEGLGDGEHKVRLVLVDADGQPMRGLFNDVTRTITVAETCADN